MLLGGAVAGAEVEGVVGVDAVGDCGEVALMHDLIEHGEEFVFAEEATIRGVCLVGGIFHLVGGDEFVMDLEGAGELRDGGAVVGGKAGGERGDGERAVSEYVMRGPG